MSKRAMEAAKKAFPFRVVSAKLYDGQIVSFDGGEAEREIFQQGYEQAEKDLALTRKDIKYIVQTFHRIICDAKNITSDEGCVKTLKLFNEQREKE